MNISIGIDIVEIADFAPLLEYPGFKTRTFTANEIMYCMSQNKSIQHFATRFAAKEAFMKALGTGWDFGIQWTQIEIINTQNGKPIIILSQIAKEWFVNQGYNNISVSLSHTQHYAVAAVNISP